MWAFYTDWRGGDGLRVSLRGIVTYPRAMETARPSQVQRLAVADRQRVIDVLAEAFSHHPMFPETSPAKSRRMVTTMINTFAPADDAAYFGIHDDGQLACAAFVYTDGYQPGGFAMVRMMWNMLRIFGFKALRGMLGAMKELDDYRSQDPTHRLELLFLGTRSDHQQRGHGKAMLEHLRDYAAQQGYEAVVLEVPKHTPARKLYESQGFVPKFEVQLPTMPLVLMRQELGAGETR